MECDHCDTFFTSLTDAQNHYSTQHNIQNSYIQCCGLQYRDLESARGHLLVHLKPYLFQCVCCNTQLNSLDSFKKHAKGHNETLFNEDEKPSKKLQCYICKEWLPDPASFQSHMQIHFKNLEVCPQCDYVCVSRADFWEHTMNMHTHTFGCELCDKKFLTKPELKVSFDLILGFPF